MHCFIVNEDGKSCNGSFNQNFSIDLKLPRKYKIIELILIEKYNPFGSTHPTKPLFLQRIQNSVLFILIVSIDSGLGWVNPNQTASTKIYKNNLVQ